MHTSSWIISYLIEVASIDYNIYKGSRDANANRDANARYIKTNLPKVSSFLFTIWTHSTANVYWFVLFDYLLNQQRRPWLEDPYWLICAY